MKQILMTQHGWDILTKEKAELEKNRPAAVEDLKKAREMGDLSENGYYKAARAKLSTIDARLRSLTHTIRFAKVREKSLGEFADIGITVVLESNGEEFVYSIVGEHEANPSEKKISHLSPLGKALIGKRSGEKVEIKTPKGSQSFRIMSIK